jgi:DNA-binding transcriptional LysR family regulator
MPPEKPRDLEMGRKIRKLHSATFNYFLAVAAEGSFRGAARRLRIASSAINRHILLLEAELGFTLFERHGRTLKLSNAGEILLHHCTATIRSFEDAAEELDALRDIRSGTVRIAASESFATDIVPAICAVFSDTYPGIRIHITVGDSTSVIASVENEQSDVGFAFGALGSRNIRTVAEFALPIGAIVGPEHPLARRNSVSIEECFAYPVVIPDTKLSFRRQLDKVTGLFAAHAGGGVEASSARLMIGIARSSRYVVFQTKLGIPTDLARGSLVFLPLTDTALKPDQCTVITSSRSEGRFAAERFCEVAIETMEKLMRI